MEAGALAPLLQMLWSSSHTHTSPRATIRRRLGELAIAVGDHGIAAHALGHLVTAGGVDLMDESGVWPLLGELPVGALDGRDGAEHVAVGELGVLGLDAVRHGKLH